MGKGRIVFLSCLLLFTAAFVYGFILLFPRDITEKPSVFSAKTNKKASPTPKASPTTTIVSNSLKIPTATPTTSLAQNNNQGSVSANNSNNTSNNTQSNHSSNSSSNNTVTENPLRSHSIVIGPPPTTPTPAVVQTNQNPCPGRGGNIVVSGNGTHSNNDASPCGNAPVGITQNQNVGGDVEISTGNGTTSENNTGTSVGNVSTANTQPQ